MCELWGQNIVKSGKKGGFKVVDIREKITPSEEIFFWPYPYFSEVKLNTVEQDLVQHGSQFSWSHWCQTPIDCSRSRTGFMCCNQAKQQGSIFTKGATLTTKMLLQTQPDPFQGQLDWPILPSCSGYFFQRYLGLYLKAVTRANCPCSSFPESFISPLCFSSAIEQNVVLRFCSAFIEVKLPEVQAIFSKPVLGRNVVSACMILFIPASTSDYACSARLLWFLYIFSSLCFLCCFFFFYLKCEHKIQRGGSSREENCPSVSPLGNLFNAQFNWRLAFIFLSVLSLLGNFPI